MKNLTKRTKILLGLAGFVIVVVVAGIVALGPSTGLFGTTALAITPSNPSMDKGVTQVLSVNAIYNCNWFTSNDAIVSFVGDATEVKTVTVQGNAAGQATIEARCGIINANHVSTTVTVTGMTLHWTTDCLTPGETTNMQVFYGAFPASGCTWSSNYPSVATVDWNPGYGSIGYITGVSLGSVDVSFQCDQGSGHKGVNVYSACGGGTPRR